MRPFRSVILATCLAIALLAPQPGVPASQDGSRELVSLLQNWLDGSARLSGRFEQRLLSGAFGGDVAESGRVHVLRPGMMRWDYTDPEPKMFMLRGSQTVLYLVDEKQVIQGRLDDNGAMMTAILAGTERLVDLFDVAPAPDGATLRLKPKGRQEAFEEVVLTLDSEDGAILAAEVLDPAGNRMVYRFPDLHRVHEFPPDLFRFDPPADVEVLVDE